MSQVWPYIPRLGVSESLSWLTDVLQSRTAEDRIALRVPRQAFGLSFIFNDKQMVAADFAYRSNPYGEWLLPAWPERSFVSGVLSADLTVVADTDADYRDGGQAVIWSGEDAFTVIQIDTVGAGVLNLSAPVGADHAAAVVAPLRRAFCPGGIDITRRHHGLTEAAMQWLVLDNIEVPETPFDQYLGLDVMSDPAVVTKGLAGRLVYPVVMVDSGLGPVAVETVRDVMRGRHSAYFVDATRAAAWRRKKWLYYLAGRQRAFWLPTWADDLVLALPITAAGNFITVEPALPLPADYVGRHLLIWDGLNFYYRQITSAILSSGNHRLYMSPVGADITEARLSFMSKVRSDADTVTIEHVDGFMANCDLQMVEVA